MKTFRIGAIKSPLGDSSSCSDRNIVGSICGAVVEFIVAIDVIWVLFLADALRVSVFSP